MRHSGAGVELARNPVKQTELRHADHKIITDALPRTDRVILERVAYGLPAICGFCGRMYTIKTATILTMLAIGESTNPKISPMYRKLMASRLGGLDLDSVALECTCGMRTTFGELRPHVGHYIASDTRQKIGER